MFFLFIFLWSITLFLNLLIIVLGGLIAFKTPKINSIYGYRTRRSMSDETSWNLANKLAGRIMFITGIVGVVSVLIIAPLVYALAGYNNWLTTIYPVVGIILTIISFIIPIIVVEKRLGTLK